MCIRDSLWRYRQRGMPRLPRCCSRGCGRSRWNSYPFSCFGGVVMPLRISRLWAFAHIRSREITTSPDVLLAILHIRSVRLILTRPVPAKGRAETPMFYECSYMGIPTDNGLRERSGPLRLAAYRVLDRAILPGMDPEASTTIRPPIRKDSQHDTKTFISETPPSTSHQP